LLEIAGGGEPRTAEAAVRGLAKLGNSATVGPLVELLDREPELAREIALALTGIGLRDPQTVAARVASRMASGDVRPEWLLVLGAVGRPEDTELLSAAIHHGDPEVRRAALEACLSQRSPVDEGTLIFALADEHPRVRAAAARVLSSYRSDRVNEALLVATRDGDPWVVAEAVRALGYIGGERAVATLEVAVSSSASQVAIAALQGLFRLNPQGLSTALKRALGHADAEVAREALQTSMRLSEQASRPLLLSALEHRSWHVRLAAADMLSNRGMAVPHDLLEARLAVEPEALVREALGRLLPGPGRG
jgi:HEAT repeat protein